MPSYQIGSIESRFIGNVFAGDRAIAAGEVIAIDDKAAGGEACLDIVGRGSTIICSAAPRG